ncbi:hypothetical protein [Derxia lacustris]|uniref:hypothetical protein n=1 Tax=Derxia lacustris TaxID=764842 RepID=UPI00111C4EA4|nr:hypothetical protein [Derxia lacustris]
MLALSLPVGLPPAPEPRERDVVRECLERVAASPQFARSRRLSRMLRHVVLATLAGQRRELSEMAIGLAVFDRLPSSYNPGEDPIVRVQARRLRDKLAAYYEAGGRADPVRIVMPCGGYVAVFRAGPSAVEPAPEPGGNPLAAPALFASNDAVLRERSLVAAGPAEPPAAPAETGTANLVREWMLAASAAAESGGPGSIVVTPLASLGLDADDRLFVDGLNEELIGALSRAADSGAPGLAGLHVCAQRLGDYRVTAPAGLRSCVLEGSIRRAGDRARASLRLSRVADGRVLWTGQFDECIVGGLAAQEALCAAVLTAIAGLGLTGGASTPARA